MQGFPAGSTHTNSFISPLELHLPRQLFLFSAGCFFPAQLAGGGTMQKETPGFGATSLAQGILPRSTRTAAWVHLPCSGLVFFHMNSPCAGGDPWVTLCHLSSLWRWGNPGRTGACCSLWLGVSLVDSVPYSCYSCQRSICLLCFRVHQVLRGHRAPRVLQVPR